MVLPDPAVLFRDFLVRALTVEGARPLFQLMITDLVSVRYPTANSVAGPGGGDWGIDTYVGRLDDSVVVWQSKFFLDWKGKDQREQVRDSFNRLMSNAEAERFTVSAWTLCVPCILPPAEQKWWDGWASRQRRQHGVQIVLWNGIELRRQLMQPDARWVADAYFAPVSSTRDPEPIAVPPSVAGLGNALFVQQLHAAGRVETDAARGLFFAAEALARDVAARGDARTSAALDDLHAQMQVIWESLFNARLDQAGDEGIVPGLIDEVMQAAGRCDDSEGLHLRPSHRMGIAHRLVEDRRAGWVRHWRQVAAAYDGTPAADVVAAMLDAIRHKKGAS